MLKLLLLASILAFQSPVQTFTVNPRWFYHHSGGVYGEVGYLIKLDRPGRAVCTGWVYPVAQWDKEDWPYRRSCRMLDFKFVDEKWGGKIHPLPYIGDYIAFVEVYEHGKLVSAEFRQFTQMEGVPTK